LTVTHLLIFVLCTSVVQLPARGPHAARRQNFYGPRTFSLLIDMWMKQQESLISTRITCFNKNNVQYYWR